MLQSFYLQKYLIRFQVSPPPCVQKFLKSPFREICSLNHRITLDKRREVLLEGSSIWELLVREDGRFVYAIDSYRGEILVIDMETGTEMSRCAIPVEPGGRLLRADSAQDRLFVGGWLAGFVNIVE